MNGHLLLILVVFGFMGQFYMTKGIFQEAKQILELFKVI